MQHLIHDLFVDRSQHQEAFCKMLEGRARRRIMLLEAGTGMGKSWLLHILAHETISRGIPLAHIDFADGQCYDSLMFIRRCRDRLGLEFFNQLTEVINCATTAHLTLSSLGMTTSGPINVNLGSENVLTSSNINVSDIGNTVVKDNFFLINTDDPTVRQIVEDRITLTFFDCLARRCTNTKVVFLFDSYERNSLRSDRWIARSIDRWIRTHFLGRIRDNLFANVIVVIAGQRTPDFGPEWNEILGRKSIEPLMSRDVKEYLFERRRLSMLTDAEIERLYQAVAGHPQMLGLIADNLERANQPLDQEEEW